MPIIMIGKMLELFAAQKSTSSEFIKQYQKYYHSGEINRSVNNKEKIFEKLASNYKEAKISTLDGISISYDDFWFNVRASNTENKVRLNLEAKTKEIMEEKRDEILKIIEQY